MDDLIDAFIEWNKSELVPRSQVEYARDITMFESWLRKPLVDATRLDIERYKRTINVSNRTKNRKLSVLRSFYAYLVDNEIISVSPTDRVKGVGIPRRTRLKILNQSNIDLLFNYQIFPSGSHNMVLSQTIFRTFYYTGLRLSELIGINVGDIDIETRRIPVIGKGGEPRTVKFPSSLIEWLDMYSESRKNVIKEGESAYFVSSKGRRLNINGVWYFFTKLKRKTGISINPHSLRHTFASHALSRGMDLAQVQELLGHAKASTTSIYISVARSTEESYDKVFL